LYSHSLSVHRLSNVEIVVLEVWCNDLCVVSLNTSLELLDFSIVGPSLLLLLDDFLEVGCTYLAEFFYVDLKVHVLFNCPWKSFLLPYSLVPEASSPRKFNRKASTTSMTCFEVDSSSSDASSAEAFAPMSIKRQNMLLYLAFPTQLSTVSATNRSYLRRPWSPSCSQPRTQLHPSPGDPKCRR
jgi:hypothetical protein